MWCGKAKPGLIDRIFFLTLWEAMDSSDDRRWNTPKTQIEPLGRTGLSFRSQLDEIS